MFEGDQRFRLLGLEEARRILDGNLPKTAETYHLRVRAVRRLMPKTTEAERQQARDDWEAQSPEMKRLCEKIRAEADGTRRPDLAPAVRTESRLEKLRRLAKERPHRCAGYACHEMIAADQLMCFEHWVLVPEWLQDRLNEAETPAAEMRWPLELVEQAIRATMLDADVGGLVHRIAGALQEELSLEVAS